MGRTPRFLTLADVAEILNTSQAQVYALVRRKELPAIRIGGRGQYRVEADRLEEFIERSYAETQTYLDSHPYAESSRDEVPTDAQ
jgi:excisionase family DNA binding protein